MDFTGILNAAAIFTAIIWYKLVGFTATLPKYAHISDKFLAYKGVQGGVIDHLRGSAKVWP